MKMLLFFVTGIATLFLLAPISSFAEPTHPNEIGLYTEPNGYGATGTDVLGAPVDVYLVLTKPEANNVSLSGIFAFECQLNFNPIGGIFLIGNVLNGEGANIGDDDHFYDEGPDWYTQFFPDSADQYEAIGEASPNYLFDPLVPARIQKFDPNIRLILSVRDPVERLWSTYEQRRRILGYEKTFEEFFEEDQDAVNRGCYAAQLKRYFEFFDEKQFHVLLFEDLTTRPSHELERIRTFLDLSDPFEIPSEILQKKANTKFDVRLPTAYRLARQCGQFLSRNLNQDWIVNLVKRSGALRIFEGGVAADSMNRDSRIYLRNLYRADVEEFGDLIGRDLLSRWHYRSD